MGVCVCVCVYALFEMAPLGDSALSLQWRKSLGGENLEFQELRDVCLPGICLPRFPGMKMRYTPFSAFSGFPGRQPCGPADSSGPAHSGRAVGLGLGRAVGLGLAQGLGLTSSFLLTALALLPPDHKRAASLWASGLRQWWAGPGSGRPGGKSFQQRPPPSPSVSARAHPWMGTLGLSLRSKGATQYPVGRKKEERP